MRAWSVPAFGLANLTAVERPRLEPGPGQVVVRLRAASLNYRDLLMVNGQYNPRQKLPLVPCSDGAGEVARVGEGVTRVKTGDRVMPCFMQGWLSGRPTKEKLGTSLGGPRDGTLADEILVEAEAVVATPAHLSDAEAATLPCAALTAWSALVTQGSLRAGETVLVQGSGGVALFALQIAKMCGARVVATSRSAEKLARSRALGADEGIDTSESPEWGMIARKLTGGVGVDHVVEVGGAATLEQSVRAVRPGGTIHLIGNLGGGVTSVNLIPIFMQNVRVQGVLVGHKEAFEQMVAAFGAHATRPVVDRVFAFDDARAAFEQMGTGAHFGKLCVAW